MRLGGPRGRRQANLVEGVRPRVLHALVFEFSGILWFYTDTDGTQSLSLRKGRLDEDKADLGPLLRDIEPGFTRWRALPEESKRADVTTAEELPNGCFIESVAAGVERLILRPRPEMDATALELFATDAGRTLGLAT